MSWERRSAGNAVDMVSEGYCWYGEGILTKNLLDINDDGALHVLLTPLGNVLCVVGKAANHSILHRGNKVATESYRNHTNQSTEAKDEGKQLQHRDRRASGLQPKNGLEPDEHRQKNAEERKNRKFGNRKDEKWETEGEESVDGENEQREGRNDKDDNESGEEEETDELVHGAVGVMVWR